MMGSISIKDFLKENVHPCTECLVKVCCSHSCDDYILYYRMLNYEEVRKAFEEGKKPYEEVRKAYNRLQVKSLTSLNLEETEE